MVSAGIHRFRQIGSSAEWSLFVPKAIHFPLKARCYTPSFDIENAPQGVDASSLTPAWDTTISTLTQIFLDAF